MDIDPSLAKHIVAVGASAWASKEIVGKILGPTAEYLGAEIRQFAEKCNINLSDIFQRAAKKLGSRLDEPGQVNARVLRGVLSEGAFAADEVAAEYFAGVLAAARSEDGRDDRGVAFLALIRDLSAYQLRLHYLTYSWVRAFYIGSGMRLGTLYEETDIHIFTPMTVFSDAIPFQGASENVLLVDHCVLGLARQGLINPDYTYGSQRHVSHRWPVAPSAGIIVSPTTHGAELYLWAHGWGDKSVNDLFSPHLNLLESDDLQPPIGVRPIRSPEDLIRLRQEVDRMTSEIESYCERIRQATEEHRRRLDVPREVKIRCEYVIKQFRSLLNSRVAGALERRLSRVLDPSTEVSLQRRLELLQDVSGYAERILKNEREAGTT